jgi:hypothetical protein
MKIILALTFASVASVASAATPLDGATRLAASLAGAPLEWAPPRVAEPTAKMLSSDVPAPGAGAIAGYAWISGTGFLSCVGQHNSGWMSGWINLRGDVWVTAADGASGNVPVSGSVIVTGSCSNGSGYVAGNAAISGTGTLYKDGRAVRTASLSGYAWINRFVTAPFASFSENVYLTGRID